MSGTNNSTQHINATGDNRIDGIMFPDAWGDSTIRYSMPSNGNVYDYSNSLSDNFNPISNAQEDAVRFGLNEHLGVSAADGFSVEGFTSATISENTTASDSNPEEIRVADTSDNNLNTARVSDFPGNYITSRQSDNGDVWFGPNYDSYDNPEAGNYEWHTHLHELGHALGLAHGHNNDGYASLPSSMDSMEYSVMTYRSFEGQDLQNNGGYQNETWGFSQTYMMSDIAALQEMYGADYTINDGDTTYSWNPGSGNTVVNGNAAIEPGGNRIFATIWDGGGNDTYDLSSYSTDLDIDLRPGESSLFSDVQQAYLGSDTNGNPQYADGNIYNALLHDGDTRSLIENATGGSGDDTIRGNQAQNTLNGGDGSDTLSGRDGSDTLDGGYGSDLLVGEVGDDTLYGRDGSDLLDGGDGNETLLGGAGSDELFGDPGSDKLNGGDGDDKLFGKVGDDTLFGKVGDDTLNGGNGSDTLSGYDGNDTLYGGDGGDTLYGKDGNDTFGYRFGTAQVDGADLLEGGSGHDKIYLDGDGRFNLTDANVSLVEEIEFSTSSDRKLAILSNGQFDSNSNFGSGLEVDANGNAEDILGVRIKSGTDLDLSGISFTHWEANNDRIIVVGDSAANTVTGSKKNDELFGKDGDDTLYGKVGDDTLSGYDGNDTLSGYDGSDTLYGKDGNDTLYGKDGDDILYGGSGSDTASFNTGSLSDYEIATSGLSFKIQGPEGDDYLENVETFKFSDDTVDSGKHFSEIGVYFESGSVQSYGGSQDQGDASVLDEGRTLELTNNAWKQASVNASVDGDTGLEFDFKSSTEGEIHGIGFDNDNTPSSNRTFQLAGSQDWGIQGMDQYAKDVGNGWQHYQIPIGDYFTGNFGKLTFAMDDDAGVGADSQFRDIEVVDDVMA